MSFAVRRRYLAAEQGGMRPQDCKIIALTGLGSRQACPSSWNPAGHRELEIGLTSTSKPMAIP